MTVFEMLCYADQHRGQALPANFAIPLKREGLVTAESEGWGFYGFRITKEGEEALDWRRADYEASCILATRVMRERLIRAGQIMPRPDDPEEQSWHQEWRANNGS